MQEKEANNTNTYYLLVTEIADHQIIEWFGKIVLIHSENGDPILDISFAEQSIMNNYQDGLADPSTRNFPDFIGINYIEFENQLEIGFEDQPESTLPRETLQAIGVSVN